MLENAELICRHSDRPVRYDLSFRAPRFSGLGDGPFSPAFRVCRLQSEGTTGSTCCHKRRFAGNKAASCDFTQLTIDTCTLASPDQGWLSTASTIVPSATIWSSPPTRDWLLRMFCVPTNPARPVSGSSAVQGLSRSWALAEPIDAIVGHAGHFRDSALRMALT